MDAMSLRKIRARKMIIFKMIVLTCVNTVLAIYLFKLTAFYRDNYSMAGGLLANLPAVALANVYLIPLIILLIGLYQQSVAWGNTQISHDK